MARTKPRSRLAAFFEGFISAFDLRPLQAKDLPKVRFFDWRRPSEQPLARYPESESPLARRYRIRLEP